MSAIRDIVLTVQKAWGAKTLEQFRVEAERQKSGIAFDALRTQDGRRVAVLLCLTDVDHIRVLEPALGRVNDGVVEDRNDVTLAELAVRTAEAKGFAFESRRDGYGRRSCLIVTATSPHWIQMIESAFTLSG